jgi:hypothetical protein
MPYTILVSVKSRTALLLSWLVLGAGCTSFHPVAPFPERIIEQVGPGDRVRVRIEGETERSTLRVASVGATVLRARARNETGPPHAIPYHRIESMEIERLNLRRTLLFTVVPVILGAVAVCQHQDCRTRAVLVGDY